jgi:cellobiose-specific phosphotransferase system component IIA
MELITKHSIKMEKQGMQLSQDVVDRLLVAKGLLAKIRFLPSARPDRISLAQAILTAHDAAELAIASVAQHLNRLPTGQQIFLMNYFSEIKKEHPGDDVAGHGYLSQLNSVRVAIKHKGIFPDPQQWYRVGERTYEYVSEWCQRYLELSFDRLDQSALIKNPEVKELYDTAMDLFQEGQYKESLEKLGLAAETLFRSNQALRNLIVGKARAEDAIKLAAFGVHANDYLALQEFLPLITYDGDHYACRWDQVKYGHPGNWNRYAAQFSLKTFVDVAIRIQDADWIPGAIEFDFLYEHKITALFDRVEIIQEKPGLGILGTINPERVVIKTLTKGESLRCQVSRKKVGFINFYQQLGNALKVEGEPPILSINCFDPIFSGEVQADMVYVTCVPRDNALVREYFPDLPEVEYKP